MFEILRMDVAPGSAGGLNQPLKVHCPSTGEISRLIHRNPDLQASLGATVFFFQVLFNF